FLSPFSFTFFLRREKFTASGSNANTWPFGPVRSDPSTVYQPIFAPTSTRTPSGRNSDRKSRVSRGSHIPVSLIVRETPHSVSDGWAEITNGRRFGKVMVRLG